MRINTMSVAVVLLSALALTGCTVGNDPTNPAATAPTVTAPVVVAAGAQLTAVLEASQAKMVKDGIVDSFTNGSVALTRVFDPAQAGPVMGGTYDTEGNTYSPVVSALSFPPFQLSDQFAADGVTFSANADGSYVAALDGIWEVNVTVTGGVITRVATTSSETTSVDVLTYGLDKRARAIVTAALELE